MAELVHREDINGALRKQFGTLKAFEAERDLPPTSVKDVLRRRPNSRVEREIASVLGRPLHQLFPWRYEPAKVGDSSLKRDNNPSQRTTHRLSAGAR